MADGQAVTAARGIHKATLAVMAEVGVIEKTRRNDKQNYQFRGIDDVVERVGPLMVKHGITCSPRVLSYTSGFIDSNQGKPMPHVFVLVEHTYRAADGSFDVVTTLGEAMDSGDKASNKAMSAALKYSHTQYFEIPTFGAAADTESQSPELAPRTQSGARPTSVPAAKPQSAPKAAPRPAQAVPGASMATSGALFPNYGSKKGQPIAGAALRDLEWYAKNARESVNDPSKARWRERELATLAALEAEIDAQTGGETGGIDEPPPPGDEDRQF